VNLKLVPTQFVNHKMEMLLSYISNFSASLKQTIQFKLCSVVGKFIPFSLRNCNTKHYQRMPYSMFSVYLTDYNLNSQCSFSPYIKLHSFSAHDK
jgi:hypothetical protein